ncbi:MAG: DUF6282 family protein [Rhodospirillaceae bacterium]|nr:DUF6282 family protein [Rhodospirillaceae bacterium]
MSPTKDSFAPPRQRFLQAHRARRRVPRPYFLPHSPPGGKGLIDLHLHCHEGQHDGLEIAKRAVRAGMRALLFKSLRPMRHEYPARDVESLVNELSAWCKTEGLAPITCRAGYIMCLNPREPDIKMLRKNLDEGVAAVWLPVGNALRSYTVIGPGPDLTPLDESAARANGGLSIIDDAGHLRPDFQAVIDAIIEYDRILFFGHRTREELFTAAEYGAKCGLRRMVVDHPFSPFIDLSIDDMISLKACGVTFNFTYNEISPVVGVDPQDMVDAVQMVGSDHFTISSDAGDLIFPDSVEAMRLMAVTLAAFGLPERDVEKVGGENAARLLSL